MVGENVKGLGRLVQTVGKTVGKGNDKGLGNILPKSRRRKVRRRQRIGAAKRIQQVNIIMKSVFGSNNAPARKLNPVINSITRFSYQTS